MASKPWMNGDITQWNAPYPNVDSEMSECFCLFHSRQLTGRGQYRLCQHCLCCEIVSYWNLSAIPAHTAFGFPARTNMFYIPRNIKTLVIHRKLVKCAGVLITYPDISNKGGTKSQTSFCHINSIQTAQISFFHPCSAKSIFLSNGVVG